MVAHGKSSDSIIEIGQLTTADLHLAGGKAVALANLHNNGFRVPEGVCVTTSAYYEYLTETGLGERIQLLLGRKEFAEMRWEELWDLALRIRSLFLLTPLPGHLLRSLRDALAGRFSGAVAVRSSAPAEDSGSNSFAGMHESFVNVRGISAVLRAIRLVWASLWSDRALLYRKELELDVSHSTIAVVVQEMVTGGCSGVAFSQSPDNTGCAMIEAVWGLNQGLVDGTVEPDRWQVELDSGSVLYHAAPQRREALGGGQVGVKRVRLAHKQSARPPLDEQGVLRVLAAVRAAERLFGRPQDMEWTMAGKELYVLQSRPITTVGGDERSWYLSLHRSFGNLQLLRRTIEDVLLPAMVADAESLARVKLAALSDGELETEIKTRQDLLSSWEQRYRDYCIPMAHGVRLFGQVYNDRLEPQDSFQFIGLLAATDMLALERNKRLEEMAGMLRNEPELAVQLRQGTITEANRLGSLMAEFVECYGDLAWITGGRESPLTALLLELAARPPRPAVTHGEDPGQLRQAYLAAFTRGERPFAADLLELARASYRLRDNDNLYLGKIKAQLHAAMDEAGQRLDRVPCRQNDSKTGRVKRRMTPPLPLADERRSQLPDIRRQARQLVGQAAVQGLGHGLARVITRPEELKTFKGGEILVCDAVDPNMTFVVPLAAGIVERRGGMLIHGAIIAREYGIPCVTGITEATRLIRNGDRLTVDGYLGLVIIDTEGRKGEQR